MASVFGLERVLVSDEVDEVCVAILEQSGIKVVKNTKLSKQQLVEEIKGYDGLVVRSATKVTREVIEAGSRLKIIGRAGTGVDNVDVEAATERGVVVMNTPDGNTLSAAELTCTMLLTISRNIAQGHEAVKGQNWKLKSSLMGNEVFGKTLVIIGLGRIGKEVALRMQAFGMKTIGFDPIISAAESSTFNVQWLPLDEIWSQADYITLHVPLIPPTKYMINAETLSRCKRGVRIVNCARGGIIDEAALLAALQSGHCAAAGLDVFEEEPTNNLDLINHNRVTSTPHLGASTSEAQVRVARDIATQFVQYSNGTALIGVINAAALSHSLDERKRPWIELTTHLSQLSLSLLSTSNLTNSELVITVQGDILKELKSGLGAAAAVGLFKDQNSDLNLINAPLNLNKHNVKIDIQLMDSAGRDSMTVELRQAGGAVVKVQGTVLGGQSYLLTVEGCEFWQPVRLVGHSVFIKSIVAGDRRLSDLRDKLMTTCNGTAVLSYVSSIEPRGAGEAVWCCVQLSDSLPSESLSPLTSNVSLVKQISF